MSITTGSEEERTALRERLTRLGASVLDKMQSHNLPHVLVAKRARGTKYDVRKPRPDRLSHHGPAHGRPPARLRSRSDLEGVRCPP